MSSNSNNPLEDIKPSSPVDPSIERDHRKKELNHLILSPKKDKEVFSIPSETSCLPPQVVEFFKDSKTTLGLLELLSITSSACSLIGAETNTAVPYLGLFSSPTYLYHSASKVYNRFKLVADAVAVNKISSAFFWGAKGLDSLGGTLGLLSGSSQSALTLFGLSTFATFGLIFTLIMPILLTILGAIGGIALGCALWKNSRAIKHYESLKELSETLEYLQGPKLRLEKEDSDTDKAFKARLHQLETTNFTSTHFSSDPRGLYIKQKLDKIQSKIRVQKEFAITMKDELRDVLRSMNELEDIFKRILTMEEGDEFKLIEDMHYLYDTLIAKHVLKEEHRVMIDANRKELRRLRAEARKTTTEANSDMHRNLCYNALFLLMSLIVVADGVMVLIAPQNAAIASYIGIGVSILDVGYILFDKNVEIEQFHQLRELLKYG